MTEQTTTCNGHYCAASYTQRYARNKNCNKSLPAPRAHITTVVYDLLATTTTSTTTAATATVATGSMICEHN
jgi:hypothetical protein